MADWHYLRDIARALRGIEVELRIFNERSILGDLPVVDPARGVEVLESFEAIRRAHRDLLR